MRLPFLGLKTSNSERGWNFFHSWGKKDKKGEKHKMVQVWAELFQIHQGLEFFYRVSQNDVYPLGEL